MATFNVVVSDPETGRSFPREVDGQDANRFMGREIGDEVDGTAVGLDGFTLEITGGSDNAGRPMRADVNGPTLSEVLLEGGTGYHPTREGERKRVSVRGREVSEAIAQLNVEVVRGEGSVPVALGIEEPEPEPDEEETDTAEAEAEESEETEESEEAEVSEGREEEPEDEESEEEESEGAESEREELDDEESEEEESDEEESDEEESGDGESEEEESEEQ